MECAKEGTTVKLSNEELKQYYFGAYEFEETKDGYLQAFQYSKEQIAYFKEASDFWYERCTASTGKSLEFITTATELSFDYKMIWAGSMDTFELWVDNLPVQIEYVEKLAKEGTLTFRMEEGEKHVILYLPADETILVKNFEINAEVSVPAKNGKLLWLGDSITQGFGPLRSGHMYVNVANRLLNYEVLNQGIGGYVYDKKSLMKMDGYQPDKIVVSLGTNQYGTEDMTDIEEYYERLMEIYGNEIPVLCISPLWRGDSPEGIPTLVSFCEKVKEIAGRYPNVTVVDGFTLVPHLSEYFLDDLHPNVIGAEMYGRNLVLAMQKLGF